MAIRSAARGVRLAERVCRIQSLPSSMVNSTSWTSPNSRSSRLRISPSSAAIARQRADDGLLGVGRAAARDDVLALGVEHEVDHRLLQPGGGIARKRHAGPGRQPAIAEHHGLHRDRGALQIDRDSADGDRPAPARSSRSDRRPSPRIRAGPPHPRSQPSSRSSTSACFVGGEPFQRLAVELAVVGDVFARNQFGKARGERGGVEAEHGLGVALQKAPTAIPCQPRPAGQAGSGPARRSRCSRH